MSRHINRSEEPGAPRARWWVWAGVLCALLPTVFGLVLTVAAVVLGPGDALGVLSDSFLIGLTYALSGLLAGIVVGLVARSRGWAHSVEGWNLAAPALSGLVCGAALFLVFEALAPLSYDQSPIPIVTIWMGQSAAIFLALRLAWNRLAGAVAALILTGAVVAASL